jgi:sigma-E factor negative regulatory protein RseA
MSNRTDEESSRQALSALMDGEASRPEAAAACSAWRQDDGSRECWHTFHLIGDVLRSQDLAAPASHDVAFVSEFRRRLAREPVVVAPRRVKMRERVGWQAATAAVAAGFVAVTGVLYVMRGGSAPPSPAEAGPVLATAPQPELMAFDGKLIRDAQLDRYLAAHRRVSNGSSVVVPGAVVRSVDTLAIDDK